MAKKKPGKAKPTKRVGRPSKLDKLNKEHIRLLCERGLTDEEMSDIFGATTRTWHNYKKKNAQFFHSIKEGKYEADEKVVKRLFDRAIGYEITIRKTKVEPRPIKQLDGSIKYEQVITEVTETTKHYPPDPTSIIFWLCNRQPDN